MFPILVSAKENDLKGYNAGGNRKTIVLNHYRIQGTNPIAGNFDSL